MEMTWREVDAALRAIAKRRGELDVEEARWIVKAKELEVHKEKGYGSFVEYIARVRGCAVGTADQRIRTAVKLQELPKLREALASGELGFCAVRTIAPVATADSEAEWIDRARGRTVREIEEMVRGEEQPQRHVLRLDLTAEAYATFREFRRVLEEENGEKLDDSAVIALMAERAVNGGDKTGPRTQIAMHVCSTCEKAEIDAAGRVVRVPAELIAMACCDALHVHGDGSVTRDIPAPLRRQVEIRDRHRCCVPGCTASSFLHIHHIRWRKDGGVHVLENLMLVCGAHHRAIHDGKLLVFDRFTFAHGDGTPYGREYYSAAIEHLRRRGIADPVPIVDFVADQLSDVPFSAFVDACESCT